MTNPRMILIRLNLALLVAALASSSTAAFEADQAAEKIGTARGICVVVGKFSDAVGIELAKKSELLVYVQLPDARSVAEARREAEAAGLDATRLHIEYGRLDRLHLADNLANAVILTGSVETLAQSEVMRVLRPGGKAVYGNKEIVKPIPAGTDDWTHPYHGPDNNPLSEDTQIVAPYLTQFLADPRYGPAPQVAVSAAGRVFKVFGNVAWHEREESFLNTVVAYDGYNGTLLWKYKLPEGMMVHRNVFVATPDTLLVGDDASCKLIDTSTGKVKDEIRPPLNVAGGTFWKWMALDGDVLYAVIGEQELKDETKRWERKEHGWPWTGISKGYNQKQQPWGYGRNLLAINIKTKNVLWDYHEQDPIDCRAVCMSHGRIYAFRFGTYLTCLDAKTGKVIWRKSKEKDASLFEALG